MGTSWDLSPGSPAPAAPFVRLGGGKATAADLLAEANGLPLLLAFFKASCPTCRLTWPYLQRLHEAYGGKAVHVVGVSQNDAATARKFFEECGKATFDLVLDPEPRFEASNAFRVEAVPHLALVSSTGILEDVFEGWSKTKMEALGTRLAGARKLARIPVVPPGDPVRDFAAG
ncbi:MAG: TlpA disulfide reductase family protein [Thermoanaerobaculia bacterium]